MIDLEVCNFQSIQQAKVRIDGFTVVLGSSDIGKSAFVRAVKFALTNASGTGFVRHGLQCDRIVKGTKKCKCFSKVVIGTPESEISWEKGDTVNCYTVLNRATGVTERYEGLDRGTPSFLSGFQRIQVGTSQELIQIPKQFEPIFLLNESGGVVADVLSDLAHLGKLNEASSLVSSDRKEVTTKRRIREEDRDKLSKTLEGFDGFDAVDVESLGSLLGQADRANALLNSLVKYQDTWSRLDLEQAALVGIEEEAIPPASALANAYKALYSVEASRVKLTRATEALELLEDVSPEALPDASSVELISKEYFKYAQYQKDLAAVLLTGSLLTGIEALSIESSQPVLDAYEQSVRLAKFDKAYDAMALWWSKAGNIEASEVPDIGSTEPLLAQLDNLTSYEDRLYRVTYAVDFAQKNLNEALSDTDQVLFELRELGICPVCNQPVSGEHSIHLEAL